MSKKLLKVIEKWSNILEKNTSTLAEKAIITSLLQDLHEIVKSGEKSNLINSHLKILSELDQK